VRVPTDALGGRWHRNNSLAAGGTATDWKQSVRAATTTALAANTRTGNVLLANANGALGTIDGVTLVVGNRLLVKDEGGASPLTHANNGIYVIDSLGAAGAKWQFTRAADADSSTEVTSGLTVEVNEGTASAGKVYEIVTADPITLNTTAIGIDLLPPLTRLNGATVPAAGALTTGNVLQVNGVSSTTYGPVNLAGGVNYVTGLLPTANLAPGTNAQIAVTNAGATGVAMVTVSGDASITAAGAVTVAKVAGSTYTVGGALTVGNVAQVNGVASVTYGALNLAGGANYVTGQLPIANLAPGTNAQIPVTNAGATAVVMVTASGDASIAASGAVTVSKVAGSTYTVGGALTVGNVAQVNGVASVTYGALNLAGGANYVTGVLPSANLATATATAAGAVSLVTQSGAYRTVRNMVLTNVANLAAFTVASATLNDNVGGGNIEGDRVLLAGQTTPAEDGIYVVGTVGGGTAPLTRATDYAATSVQPAGLTIGINEGTIFGGRQWFASLAGAITVATSSPAFYPRKYVRVTGVMAGAPGIMALSAEWILSATKSTVTPIPKAPGTQGFLSIGTLTAGFGNGAVTVTSTANETSTLQISIEN
jgi:hypothetical protein